MCRGGPRAGRLALAGAVITLACTSDRSTAEQQAAPDRLRVQDAVIPVPAGRDVASLYLTIVNDGAADTLVGFTSPAAEVASLHRTVVDGGMVRMRPLVSLPLSARAEIRLAPGAVHGMLEGLSRSLQSGDTVRVTFFFARSDSIVLGVPVRPYAALTR